MITPEDKREIVKFTISLINQMGLKRSVGKQSFIDSVLQTLDTFYEDVVQHLQQWQPKAPKIQKAAEAEKTTKSNLGDKTSESASVANNSRNAGVEPIECAQLIRDTVSSSDAAHN